MRRLLRLPRTLDARCTSKSALYEDIKNGLMTPAVRLCGGRSVAWPEDEIIAINNALIAGKSKDEIKELVKKLIADRKTLCGVTA